MSENIPASVPTPRPVPVTEEDPQAKATRLETELRRLRADLAAGAKAVLRVLPPHSSMTYGGITVTSQPTEVPASAVPGLHEAAQNAGVNLTQEA